MENDVDILFMWFEGVKDDIVKFFPNITIDHKAIWANDVLRNLVSGIKEEDDLAIKLACYLILDDPFPIPFGKINKSNIGRALKSKASLIKETDKPLIIKKVIEFLQKGIAPQEVKVYCKLIKKFDLEEFVEDISNIKTENKYAIRLKKYLLNND
jgi:hypothetical protein